MLILKLDIFIVQFDKPDWSSMALVPIGTRLMVKCRHESSQLADFRIVQTLLFHSSPFQAKSAWEV